MFSGFSAALNVSARTRLALRPHARRTAYHVRPSGTAHKTDHQQEFREEISMKRVISILIVMMFAGATWAQEAIRVGLITKTETNPFFVKMREGAQATAEELGVELFTAAGTFDCDNGSQVTAIENMVAAGVQGILITPSDTRAIVPAIERAREQGVVVIALDTPTDPESAVDELFATDNFQAGVLIGQYARAAMGDTPPVIATLDLAPGITVGALRHNGFLHGYGLVEADGSETDLLGAQVAEVVCSQDTRGDQALGQTAMENCLVAHPDINVVYTRCVRRTQCPDGSRS
jgi:fructose transport system substrate-binding protein